VSPNPGTAWGNPTSLVGMVVPLKTDDQLYRPALAIAPRTFVCPWWWRGSLRPRRRGCLRCLRSPRGGDTTMMERRVGIRAGSSICASAGVEAGAATLNFRSRMSR
jgi:hypothetical protein